MPHPQLTLFAGARPTAPAVGLWFTVLASSSSGNCTAVVIENTQSRRLILIDAGLSPRRTRALLATRALAIDELDAVVLTHLDHDHWNPAWVGALPPRTRLIVHKRHVSRAEREGALYQRTEVIDHSLTLDGGVELRATLGTHDTEGSAVYRFDLPCGRSLGLATDLGHITPRIVEHLRGVEALAIESNYCPDLQLASDRPDFLKRRIMDGRGHLSNAQCADAVRRIGPRGHVVLLHLSRQCNTPDLAAAPHAGAPYTVIVAPPDAPTAPVRVADRPEGNPGAGIAAQPGGYA